MAHASITRHDKGNLNFVPEPGIPCLPEIPCESSARTQIHPWHPVTKTVDSIDVILDGLQRYHLLVANMVGRTRLWHYSASANREDQNQDGGGIQNFHQSSNLRLTRNLLPFQSSPDRFQALLTGA